MSNKIITDFENDTFSIILNNPSKHNCIGLEMLYALQETLNAVQKNDRAKVVVLKGAGNKSFSTGGNIKEFRALTGRQVNEWIELGNKVFNQLENLEKPTLALIDGYAMGGGLEIALACDFRLATKAAVFSSPELGHGWLPGWGGMTRLRRLIGEANAKRVVILGERLTAEKGLRLGLLTKILEEGKEEEELSIFVSKLKKLKPAVFALAKTALMDPNRTTTGPDLQFDVLAVQVANQET